MVVVVVAVCVCADGHIAWKHREYTSSQSHYTSKHLPGVVPTTIITMTTMRNNAELSAAEETGKT